MRILLVISIVTLSIFNNLSSQISFNCGIEGSINTSQYSFTHIPIRELESPFQYGSGIRFGAELDNKINIRTGLLRTNLGLNIEYDWHVPDQTYITDPSLMLQSFFNYSYLTIPFSFGYRFHFLERLQFVPQVGANYQICIEKSEYSIFGDGSQKPIALDTDGIGSNHFQITALISFEIILNDKWFVNIEPYINRSLLKQHSPYYETKYYTIGGSFGLFRSLN